MSKGIAKILSGLLVLGMVAGLVPAVPGGTVHAKAEETHTHCVCGTGKLTVGNCSHEEEEWIGIKNLSEIDSKGAGNYYLMQDVKLEEVWSCRNEVKLCLNGHSITREIKSDGSFPYQNAVIHIVSSSTLTLTDCTLTKSRLPLRTVRRMELFST